MRTRFLGDGGPDVSVVGLGCNNFGARLDLEGTRAVVDAALDEGVTLFDTADIYGNGGGSEELLGQVLEGRRDRVLLATKFGGDMGDGTKARGSRTYVRKAIDASLGRLRMEYVDLYQYHFPDGITPYEETFGALDALEHFAEERGVTLLDVAIGGLLAQPAVASVIAGATKPEQVRANVAAGDWEPTPSDLAALNAIR